jgi:hypothetical protein
VLLLSLVLKRVGREIGKVCVYGRVTCCGYMSLDKVQDSSRLVTFNISEPVPHLRYTVRGSNSW